MKKSYTILIVILIGCYFTQIQAAKRDEKVRFSFGLAAFSMEQVNKLLADLDWATTENGFSLSPSRFKYHFLLQLDYEHDLGRRYSYLFTLQYSRAVVHRVNEDLNNGIYQGLDYFLKMLQGSLSLVRRFPVYKLNQGSLDIVTGAGLELVYTHADFLYVYSQLPLTYQKIDFLRTGYVGGAKIFIGLEVPLIPSIFLELQTGYSYLPEQRLTGKINSANLEVAEDALEPINPDVLIRNNKYNLSRFWLLFGGAYYF